MITARDMAIATAPLPRAGVNSLAERILLMVLFVTVLASCIAFVEPSPHDGLMGLLAVACVIAGVRVHRYAVLMLIPLLLWNMAGLMSLFSVAGDSKSVTYYVTSIYLAVAAILFACLLAQNTELRMAAVRSAYIAAAVIAATAGICGYFRLFPGAADWFAPTGRAFGTFKDPNVYGPFLILPALFVIERMLSRRIRLTDVALAGILLLGLLLSFSRGAWFHFAVSAAITIALTFLTAPTSRVRMRVFGLSAGGLATLAVIVVVLLSLDSIGGMFKERAQLVQEYDVGEGGRFRLQQLALSALFDFPNGMGPFGFARAYGLQQHNVYLQAFIVYGWVGGVSYIVLLLATLVVGLPAALIRTPWQPCAIAAFGAFIGEIMEGAIIDTDHWRHFFLILGIVWGLAAASFNARTSRFGGAVAPR